MIKKTPKIFFKKNRKSHNEIKIKKMPNFYKVLLSVAIFFMVILFYFVVLVSNSPKSIDFITKKIQQNLEENFDNRIKIKDSFVNFTTYGTFRLVVNDISIAYKDIEINEENAQNEIAKDLNIPKIEAEFPLINLIFLNFNPSKIKIVSPEITINNAKSLLTINENVSSNIDNEQLLTFIKFLSGIKNSKNAIENFEIEDAKIILQTSKTSTTIIVKRSKIITKNINDSLNISLSGSLFFVKNKSELTIDSACVLSKLEGFNCNINIANFAPNSVSDIHPIFSDFANIDTNLNGSINIIVDNDKSIQKASFNLRADRGNFEFKKIFQDKIEFRNLKVGGEADILKKALKIDNLDADLISNIANQTEIANPHLSAQIQIIETDLGIVKLDSSIILKDILLAELSHFWPLNLSQNNIRDWVIKSINYGIVKKASANLSLVKSKEDLIIDKISAQLNFENANLQYSANFPELSNLSGVANFSKNNMVVNINSGKVLDSKIMSGQIAIDDFNAPINLLSIMAKTSGAGGDSLKHISNNFDYRQAVARYLNGNALTDIKVLIPLSKDLKLNQIAIDVKSKIENNKNNVFDGAITVKASKEVDSNLFRTSIDLKDCAVINQEIQLSKNKSQDAFLYFDIDVSDDKNKFVKFQNIILVNRELESTNVNKTGNKTAKKNSALDNKIKLNPNLPRIEGEFDFAYSPFKIINLRLKNYGYVKNNFNINYSFDKEKDFAKLFFSGKYLNLSSILNNKSGPNSYNFPKNFRVNLAVDNIELLNKKQLRNFRLNANCSDFICYSGNLFGNILSPKNTSKIFNLKIVGNQKNDDQENYNIEGVIGDIGSIAEALGISTLITGGDFKVSITQNIVNNKLVLEGNLKSTSNITIYESEVVKKLAKDDLFSQAQDKIFSDEKTTFGSLNLDFAIDGSDLIIKALIANNFKIGITAKGKINLRNKAIEIKGMIVPGYIINSIFGLGKVPILGGVIRGVLTGGEGGGLFSMRYEYVRKAGEQDGKFTTNKVSAFVPSSISNLFE